MDGAISDKSIKRRVAEQLYLLLKEPGLDTIESHKGVIKKQDSHRNGYEEIHKTFTNTNNAQAKQSDFKEELDSDKNKHPSYEESVLNKAVISETKDNESNV